MGGGVRQVCPTQGPAGVGVDPSAAHYIKNYSRYQGKTVVNLF